MKKSFTLLLLTVLFALVACDYNESQKSEQETFIDNLTSQSQNLGATDVHKNILGIWDLNSMFIYDDNWQTVVKTMIFKGEHYDMGLATTKYTFTADGKGQKAVKSITLGFEGIDERIVEFDWLYDVETHMLALKHDNGYNVERKLSALNNEYLVLDYYDSVNKQNTREIYKRIVE